MDHFKNKVEQGHPNLDLETANQVEYAIGTYIKNLSVAKEFKQIFNDVINLKAAHMMHSRHPLIPTEKHKITSKVINRMSYIFN